MKSKRQIMVSLLLLSSINLYSQAIELDQGRLEANQITAQLVSLGTNLSGVFARKGWPTSTSAVGAVSQIA